MDHFICDFCFATISQGDLYYKINGKTACEICASKKNIHDNTGFASFFSNGNNSETETEIYINDDGSRDF